MPASRRLSLPWRLLEAYFQRRYQIRILENDPDSLIAYNLYPHQGPDVPLRCGAVLHSGDLVLEIHFRREALQRRVTSGDPTRLALTLLHLGDRDVPRLARALEREPELQPVRALHALTLFHRGVERYGFEVQPVRERWSEAWFTAWHRLLMARDHPNGGKRVREHREKLVTRHVWISREELRRRFPPPPSRNAGP